MLRLMTRLRAALLATAAAGLLTACGSGTSLLSRHPTATGARGAVHGPDPAAIRVIKAWSQALRQGDVRGAARYFALPSLFANGVESNGQVPGILIHTERDAEAVNASLPCGALFISATQAGRYVNVLFRLTGRRGPGGGCGSGAGQEARTNFIIAHGRIVQWVRAPDQRPQAPGTAPPGQTTPTTPTTPAVGTATI